MQNKMASVAQEYITFYCRTDDPMYIKRVKLEILSEIVDNSNAYEIASEITEYVRDINPVMVREAVKAVGKIALAVIRFEFLPSKLCSRFQMWAG